MHIWKTLLLLNSGQYPSPYPMCSTQPTFPTGQLTASAWEGWWHEENHLDTGPDKPKTYRRC